MNGEQPVTILLVEDDPGHSRLIEKNLRRANINNQIIKVEDGQKAMDFLLNEGEFAGSKRPPHLLVLLDLNIPILDGYQVLKRMKSDDKLKRIPVVMLTTTEDTREVAKCYELGCNVYVTKPVDYDKFAEAIRSLGMFLSVITIPPDRD